MLLIERLDDGVIVRDIIDGGWFTLWFFGVAIGVVIWARRSR